MTAQSLYFPPPSLQISNRDYSSVEERDYTITEGDVPNTIGPGLDVTAEYTFFDKQGTRLDTASDFGHNPPIIFSMGSVVKTFIVATRILSNQGEHSFYGPYLFL